MVLVNFDFKAGNEVLKKLRFLSTEPIECVLDFSNSIKQKGELKDIKIIYPKDIDSDLQIHKEAIEMYVGRIGKLNATPLKDGTKLRDLDFAGFPVFWITEISIKHAQSSFLKNYFYFLNLLKSGKFKTALGGTYFICLPPKEIYFDEFIEEKLAAEFGIKSKSFSVENKSPIYLTWNRLSFIKESIKQYSFIRAKCLEIRKGLKVNTSEVSIFTDPESTWRKKEGHDYVFKELMEYSRTKKTSNYIPFFVTLKDFKELINWEENWDTGLLYCFPSKLESLIFAFKHFKFIRRIKELKISEENSPDCYVNDKVIKKEVYDIAYLSFWKVFFCFWLSKYFRNGVKSEKKIFYQDEFYDVGRLISLAKSKSGNKLIKSFGVQHGLFFSGHTVYSITDSELKGKNSMPVPDKFVVWGDLFKREFLRNNSLGEDYVLVAGNFKYNSTKIEKKSSIKNVSSKLVLWCVTVEFDTTQMFEVIKESLVLVPDLQILVRCHPLHNIQEHISQLFLSANFKKYRFSTATDIFSDIEESDIMVTSSASTAFIDGLIGNIPTINIVLPDYQMERFEVSNLYNVITAEEFSHSFQKALKKHRQTEQNNVSEINAPLTNWEAILN